MTTTSLINFLNNLSYSELYSQMNKAKPETWFLPPGYRIVREVHHTGCVNIKFYIPSMGSPANARGELFDSVLDAHKHYQEGLLIEKLNAQAKR